MKKIGLSPTRCIKSKGWQLLAVLATGLIAVIACVPGGGGPPPATITPVPSTATDTPESPPPATHTPIPAPATDTPTPLPPVGTCVDFEDLALGTTYNMWAFFTSSGVVNTAVGHLWSDGTLTMDGFAEIGNAGLAGGSGNEIALNNIAIAFGAPSTPAPYAPYAVSMLTFKFGEFGGNINLNINGNILNFENFDTLPATIGGATVTVVNGHGNDMGSLEFRGVINSFPIEGGPFIISISGQELWLDDVCWYP